METTTPRYHKDAIGRRKRFSRCPTGKYIRLNPRRLAILKILNRYQYLNTSTIYALIPKEVQGHYQTHQSDLEQMFHEDNNEHGDYYLNRPEEQQKNFNANHTDLIYSLGKGGRAALEEEGIEPEPLATSKQLDAFPHGLMILEVLSNIEVGLKDTPYRLVSQKEILDKAQKDNVAMQVHVEHRFSKNGVLQKKTFDLIPDAVFGIDYGGKYRFFALEAENRGRCTTKDLRYSSYLRKVLGYKYLFEKNRYKKYLNIPNLIVMSVGPHKTRVKGMKEVVSELVEKPDNFIFGSNPVFGSRLQPPSPDGHFFTDSWERIGNPLNLTD